LHLGFIDLHGGTGRRFGSVGLALATPRLEFQIMPAETLTVEGADNTRIAYLVKAFDNQYHTRSHCNIRVQQTIPAHKGLGSGTQTALAIGQGLAKLHNLDIADSEIAMHLGRGRRSGIGIHAFGQGGLLVDAGVKAGGMPTLIFRHPFPDRWRILLITRKGQDGLHGENERYAFKQLPQFSKSCAGALSRTVLMKLMPSVIEQDFASFSQAVHKLQNTMKDYFSSVEKQEVTTINSEGLLEYLSQQGIKGVGQTSWGPTVFAIMENQSQAEQLKAKLIDYMHATRQLDAAISEPAETIGFSIVSGDNQGMVMVAD